MVSSMRSGAPAEPGQIRQSGDRPTALARHLLLRLGAGVLLRGLLLCAAGILVSVVRRRRGRKLTKTLVALVAGSVCGALWMLLVDTVANAIRPDTINDSAVLLVGAVTALVAALFLSAPQSLTEVEGLSMIVIGFHSLALPISALISFLVAGAAWLPGASAELRTVGLGVAGLLVGALLVFLGDRVLRVRRMRVHRHH